MARKTTPNELKLCVDRVVPSEKLLDAALLALAENNFNEPPPIEIKPGKPTPVLEMALATSKKWNNGRKLKIKFLDGSVKQKKKTQQYAEHWLQWANLSLDFNGGSDADIRISFKQQGSWSALGTDSLLTDVFKKTDPTMNYGWLRDDSDETEWRRVVLHEFGHALSAIHEHQNPKAGIKWNLAAVYKAYSGPPNNWSKEQIDFNIVQKYSVDSLNATDFDGKSIMLYPFPAELIQGGKATARNTDASANDQKFIGEMYPKAQAAPTLEIAGVGAMAMAEAAPPRQPVFFGAADFRLAAKRLQKLRAR